MAFILKEEFEGKRVIKGSQVITLSNNMSQQELAHYHKMMPGFTYSEEEEAEKERIKKEQEDTITELIDWSNQVKKEKLEQSNDWAKKQVEAYIKKKKNAKDN